MGSCLAVEIPAENEQFNYDSKYMINQNIIENTNKALITGYLELNLLKITISKDIKSRIIQIIHKYYHLSTFYNLKDELDARDEYGHWYPATVLAYKPKYQLLPTIDDCMHDFSIYCEQIVDKKYNKEGVFVRYHGRMDKNYDWVFFDDTSVFCNCGRYGRCSQDATSVYHSLTLPGCHEFTTHDSCSLNKRMELLIEGYLRLDTNCKISLKDIVKIISDKLPKKMQFRIGDTIEIKDFATWNNGVWQRAMIIGVKPPGMELSKQQQSLKLEHRYFHGIDASDRKNVWGILIQTKEWRDEGRQGYRRQKPFSEWMFFGDYKAFCDCPKKRGCRKDQWWNICQEDHHILSSQNSAPKYTTLRNYLPPFDDSGLD